VFQKASDDLILNWSHADPTPEVERQEASATFDWDAQSSTAEAEIPVRTLEVPSTGTTRS